MTVWVRSSKAASFLATASVRRSIGSSPEDLKQARATLQLIRERGFHRDKQDLVEQFDQLLSERS